MTGTSAQLLSLQCAVWRSDMMQVAARYIEDRRVDVRHVAVVILSCTAGKGDRHVIKLVSVCLDDGSVFRAEKEGCIVAHMFAASLGAPACECTIPVGVVVGELSVVTFDTLVDDSA